MVLHKKRFKAKSWILYAHSLLHGILIYLFSAQWDQFLIPIIIAITHFFIDLWKLYRPDKALYFLLDQAFHFTIFIIIYVVITFSQRSWIDKLEPYWNSKTVWAILFGYLILIWPMAILIGYLTQRWRTDIGQQLERSKQSLAEAGKWIGMFERILVFTFIISSQFAGIGFLITAKSILRFNETKKDEGRKEAEYILIGTLISFAFAILTGLFIKILIDL